MSQTPSEDQPLKQEIGTLIGAKQSLKVELQNAPSSQKSFFANIINDINQELNDKQDEYGRFLEGRSIESLASLTMPFTAAFEGTVRVEIDDDDDGLRGPHDVEFTPDGEGDTSTLRVQFTETTAEVVEMPPIEMDEEETDYGKNTTTVTRITNDGRTVGTFDEQTGRVELPLDLFFENSLDSPVHESDAPANFDLTTEGVSAPVGTYNHVDLDGAPLNSDTMKLKVVGESTFEDISGRFEQSILGGKDVVLSAEGELTDISGPPLDVPSSVSFGKVAVGDMRTRVVSFENTTGSNVMISIPEPPDSPTGPGAPGVPTFSWTPTGNNLLRRGDEMNVHVMFAPGANEQARMTLTITGSDSGSPHSITLRGTGIGGPGNGGGNGGGVHPL